MESNKFKKLIAQVLVVTTFLTSFGANFPFAPVPIVEAAAPFNKQINYQGRLMDSSGTSVPDGNYHIQFNLYTVSSGGSTIWTEDWNGGNKITVTNGLFSVMLGTLTSISSVDFNQTLYLGVTIESDAEMTPRKILGAVPAAFVSATSTKSADSDLLAGQNSSYYLSRANQTGTQAVSTLSNYDWTFGTNFGTTVIMPTTTMPIFARGGLYASSTSQFAQASTTQITVSGNSYFSTIVSGVWNGTAIGDAYLTKSGDWTGTFDGQEGSWYIANSFSTTSADVWDATKNRWATTTSDYWITTYNKGFFFSTTSADYYANASTTIPKTYSNNTFTGNNTFNGSFTLGALSGPLDARNGVVSATTSVGVFYGGTGATSFGQGWIYSNGGTGALAASTSPTVAYITATSTATSTFGGNVAINGTGTSTAANGINISNGCFAVGGVCLTSSSGSGITALGSGFSTTTGTTITFATSTTAFNGLTPVLSIVGTANSLIFNSTLTGTLTAGGGGTGISNPTAVGVLVGSYSGGSWQQISTSSLEINTDNLVQGSTNLFYTNARVLTYLNTFDKGYFFSSTSADYWDGTKSRWATTSSDYWIAQYDKGYFYSTTSADNWISLYPKGYFFSTTSADYFTNTNVNSFIAGSTTIPKTYTANTFTALQTLSGGLTLTGLNGPLDARNGVVGATTSIGVLYGGTGATSFSPNSIIVSNANGTALVATTSNLTISTITATSSATSTFSGGLTVANFNQTGSATSTFNTGINLASGCFSIGNTCLTSFSNTLAGGGTGTTTFYNGGVVFSDGNKLTQSASAANFFWDESNKRLGLGSSSPWAALSVNANGANPSFAVGSSSGTSFVVAGNGNVGIGTANPTIGMLNVGGYTQSSGYPLIAGFNGNSSGGASVEITNADNSSTVNLILGTNSNNALSLTQFGAGMASSFYGFTGFTLNTIFGQNNLVIGSTAATGNVAFNLGGTERMRLSSNGNVGIGTTTPGDQYQLTISSSTAPQLSLAAGTGISQWTFRNAGGNLYLATTTANGTATTSTSALTISGTGFGTTTVTGLNINGFATTTSNVGFDTSAGCYAISGNCITLGSLTGTVAAANGGTGATSFGQGWIYSDGGTNALNSSTSPTARYFIATSTTATSTLPLLSASAFALGNGYINSFTSGDLSISNSNLVIGAGKIQASYLKAVNSPTDEFCLTYESTVGDFEWQNCASGSGGAAGTWSTTTSSVLGTLINYPNNSSDVVVIGSNATTSGAEFWFDPNIDQAFLSGKIGIGTVTPSATLSINANGASPSFTVGSSSTYLTVLSSGKTGIGTAAPVGRLHVMDSSIGLTSAALNGEQMIFEATDAGMGIFSDESGNFGSRLSLGEVTSGSLVNKWTIVRKTTGGGNGLAFTFGTNVDGTANGEILRLTPVGTVGIGTTTPISALTVASSTGIQLSLADSASPTSNLWGFRSAGGNLYIATSTFSATSTMSALTINQNGFLGIGTTSPGTTLSVGGIANFTGATSTLYGTGGINLSNGCFAVGGVCVTSGTSGITALGSGFSTTTGSTITFATSSTSYHGLTFADSIVSTTNSLTFTPIVSGTLDVGAGGTGQSSFGQGWLSSDGSTISASTSPTVRYVTATSTTASSTFPLLVASTAFALGADYLTDITGTGLSVVGSALTNSGVTSIVAGSNVTISGATGAVTINAADRWATSTIDAQAITPAGALRVGIGTTTPISALTIASSTGIQLSLADSASSTAFLYGFRSANNNLYIATSTFSATSTMPALTINGNGYLGLGTTSPGTQLSVAGVANFGTGTSSLYGTGLSIASGCYSINGTCLTLSSFTGTLAVANGGTGQTSFGQGWLSSDGSTISASTSPTVRYVTATSTTASSTFPLLVASTAFALGADYLTDITGTGLSVVGSALTNSGVTSIVAGSNVTISGATGAVTINAADRWATSTIDAQAITPAGALRVGIGTTTPISALTIASSTGIQLSLADSASSTAFLYGFRSANNNLYIATSTFSATSTMPALTINSNGFLGLGTTSPGTQLSVAGVANFGTGTSSLYGTGLSIASGCYSINGTCLTLSSFTGTLAVANGGTGQTSFGQGWLSSDGSTLSASTSPTVRYVTATSTTASSTFPLLVASTAFALGADYLTDITGTGLSVVGSALTNSGVTSIVAGSNVTISGATGAVTINAADRWATSTIDAQAITPAGALRVGIGTTTPISALTIASSTGIQLSLADSASSTAFLYGFRSANNNLYIATSTFSATSTMPALTINGNGYLGLGTTSPGTQLSVAGVANFGTGTSSLYGTGLSIASGCYSINGTCLTLSSFTGTLAVANGGTGQTSFGQGWLSSDGSTISASTSPTVRYVTATSTTASSTFPLLVASTAFALGADYLTDITGTGLSVVGSALTNSGVTSIVAGSNVTISGATGAVTINAADRWATSTIDAQAITPAGALRVGIGTTTPISALTIASSTGIQLSLADSASSTAFLYGFRSANNNLYIATSTFSATSTMPALTINGNGYLGLGTTSPGTQLSVAGVANFGTGTSSLYGTGLNIASGCFAVGGNCISLGSLTGTVAVANGGTGATSFGQGWIYSDGGTGALNSSSSPTVRYVTATSSTATSTFVGGLVAGGSSGLNVLQNGNVGIGTVSPTNKLSVNGNISGSTITGTNFVSTSLTATNTFAYSIDLTGGCFANNGVCLGTGSVNNGTAGFFSYYPSTGTVVDDQSILYTDGTNIGIGISSGLSALLHVKGSSEPVARFERVAGAADNASYIATDIVGHANSDSITDGFGGALSFSFQNNSGSLFRQGMIAGYHDNSNDGYGGLRFYTENNTSDVEAMRLTSLGYLAIGTTTPSNSRLTIASSTGVQLSLAAGTGVSQFVFRNAGGNLYIATTSAAGTATSTLSALTINSNGFLGLGTTSPGTQLSVAGVANFGTGTSSLYGTGLSIASGCYSINGTCLSLSSFTGTLAVAQGGTGQTSFGQGWLSSDGSTLSASTSPTVRYVTATSTTASSTFPLLVASTAFALGADYLTDITGTGLSVVGSALTNSGVTSIVAGSNVTISGATGAVTINAADRWATSTIDAQAITPAGALRVGIGTTTPISALTIASSTGIQLSLADSASSTSFLYGFRSANNNLYIATSTFSATSTMPALTINGNGFLGLGTTSPGTQLSVAGVANFGTGTSSLYGTGLSIASGCYSINGTCLTLSSFTGTLAVANGGTGQTSFGQGWLSSDGSTISASTSPTVRYVTATSTTASSTFPLLVASTAFALGADYLTDITGTGLSVVGSALTNSGVTSIVAGSNVTISGATGAVTINAADRWATSTIDAQAITPAGALRVGIGTTTPISALTIASSTGIQLSLADSASSTAFLYGFRSANNNLYIATSTFSATSTMPALTINGNGYLGLGTTSPGTQLSVAGVANFGTGTSSLYGTGLSIASGCYSINGTCLTLSSFTGTLAVANGGTGQTSFGQGWLSSDGSTISASTSPTVRYVTATSTTASSTFPLLVASTAFALGADYLTDITGTGLSVVGSALTNSGVTSIVAGSNVTISGATGAVTINAADRWATSTIDAQAITPAGALRVGIGTTTPISALTIASSTGIQLSLADSASSTAFLYGFRSANNNLYIATSTFSATSTMPALTINGNGYLGLGTTSPGTQLSVAGVANFGTGTSSLYGTGLSIASGCYSINGTCLTLSSFTGTLAVANGGTGQTSFGQGWLSSDGSTISASTSPTVRYVTATSTTASSTFPLLVASTAFALGADYLTDITGTGLSVVGSALTNSGVTSIVAGSNVTISGATGAVTINAADRWATSTIDAQAITPAGALRVGIGTTTPISALTIASSTGIQLSLADSASSTAFLYGFRSANNNLYIATSTFSATSTMPALTINGNGYLGLGTTSPGTQLSVAGVANFGTGTSTIYNGLTTTRFNSTASSTLAGLVLSSGGLQISTLAASGCAQFDTSGNLTNTGTVCGTAAASSNTDKWATTTSTLNPNAIFVNASNNTLVGIGTTTPMWQLDIASSTGAQLALTDSTNVAKWTFRNAGGKLFFATTTGAGTATSTMAALTINSNGFLGLGTTSPGTQLSVAGVANFSNSTSTIYNGLNVATFNQTGSATSTFAQGINLAAGCFSIGNTCLASGGSGTVSSGVFGQATFYGANGTTVSGTSTLVFGTTTADANNIGIGTSSPWAKLSVDATGATPSFAVGSSSGTYFVIDQNGNVGIGSSSPIATLSVFGPAKPDSVSTLHATNAGSVLTVLGGAGGDTSYSSSGVGGTGGTLSLSGGAGGINTAGTVRNGGFGGALTFTGGAGADQSGGSSIDVGGDGGAVYIRGGAGGSGSSGGINGGANGGNIFLDGGTPGTGSTANGTAGSILIGTVAASGIVLGSGGGRIQIYGASTGVSPKVSINTEGTADPFSIASSSGDSYLRVASAGNVGIGSSSPWATLSVNATGSGTAFAIGSSSGSLFSVNTLGKVSIGTSSNPSLFIYPQTPTGASSFTDDGVIFNASSTLPSGLVTEVSGQILTYGINVPQVGTRDNNSVGGFLRLDTRTGGDASIGVQAFSIFGFDSGGANSLNRFAVSIHDGTTLLTPSGGNVGVGTTTLPQYALTIASTTAPQLSLVAGTGISQWTFRNAGGNLYVATTTTDGTATSSKSALTVDSNGFITVPTIAAASGNNCLQVDSNGKITNTTSACGTSGGASGTWSTTTSSVPGTLLNYSNNNSDVVTIGTNSTTSAKFFFDPNIQQAYFSGKVGIGSTTPLATLSVNANGTTPSLAVGSSSGTSLIVAGSGKVGVGTANPIARLHVMDSSIGLTSAALNGEQMVFEATDAGLGIFSDESGNFGSRLSLGEITSGSLVNNWTIIRKTTAGGNALAFTFGTNADGTANGEILRLTPVGTVGIGTSTPISSLTIASSTGIQLSLADSASSTAFLWGFRSANNNLYIATSTFSATSSVSAFKIDSNGVPTIPAIAAASGSNCLQVDTTGKLSATGSTCGSAGSSNSKWATSTVDTLAITPAGALRVGIGTTTPISALTIASSTGIQLSLADSASSTSFLYGFRSANNNLYIATSTFSATSTMPALTINGNGYLGLGTTSPGTQLSVAGVANFGTGTSSLYGTGLSIASGCYSINGTCLSLSSFTGTLAVANGGTGQTSFGQGWLSSDGSTISASTSPTVRYVTATSTTASSTFPLLVASTAFALGADYLTDITGTGLSVVGSALTNSGVTSIVAGSNVTISGATGAVTINAADRWATSTIDAQAITPAGALRVGIGTSTPISSLTVASSTGIQLSLVDSSTPTANIWGFRSAGGNLYIATSTFSATSSKSALTINSNGYLGLGSSTPASELSINGVANFGVATSSLYGTGGMNLAAGCYAIGGTCLATGGSGTVSSGVFGQATFYGQNGTVVSGTSTLVFGTTTADANNIGIGTTSPYAKLSVRSLAGETAFAVGSSSGSTFVIDGNGNVGIGTSAPAFSLDVQGNNNGPMGINVQNQSTGAANSNLTVIQAQNSSGNYVEQVIYGPNAAGTFWGVNKANLARFDTNQTFALGTSGNSPMIFATNNAEKMRIDNLGNVGIGTSTPISSLTIASSTGIQLSLADSASSTAFLWGFRSANNNLYIATSTFSATSSVSAFKIDSNGVPTIPAIAAASGSNCLQVDTTGKLSATGSTCGSAGSSNSKWATSTVDTLAITPAGALRVGIGTTTPISALTIASSTGIQLSLADSASSTSFLYGFRSANNNLYIATSTFSATSTMPALTINGNGYLGLGTTSPGTQLSVAGVANFSNSTSTIYNGLNVATFNQTGSATSTFAQGINLAAGCFSIGNTCLASGGSGTVNTGTAGQVAYYAADGTAVSGTSTLRVLTSGNIAIATTTGTAKLSIVGTTTDTGAGAVASIYASSSLGLTTNGGFEFGNRFINNVAVGSATGTFDGEFIRMIDNSSGSSTVRGLEVQAWSGGNTLGVNTGIATFAKTFGIQATIDARAGGIAIPAAVFADLDNSAAPTQGNAIRAYTNDATTADLVSIYQETSAFSGTGLIENLGTGGSFTGNFIKFQNAGTNKFFVDYNGALALGAATTTANAMLTIATSTSSGDNDLFRIIANGNVRFRVDADGDVFSDGGTTMGNGADVAENYNILDDSVAGIIVDIATSTNAVKSSRPYDPYLLGVVSTKPALIIGATDDASSSPVSPDANLKPVALSGRVPVKVTDENGAIKPGDYITSSEKFPGYAMKATHSGYVVGQAIDGFDGDGKKNTADHGTVRIFMKVGYQDIGHSLVLGEFNDLFATEDYGTSTTVCTGYDATTSLCTGNQTVMGETFTLNQVGKGDIFRAQKNGEDKFVIHNDGSVGIVASSTDPRLALLTITNNGKQIFHINTSGDLELTGHLTVGKDTAGTAVVKSGSNQVKVAFENPYDIAPKVVVTIEGVPSFYYGVVEKDENGFTIRTSAPLTTDAKFDWVALASKGADQSGQAGDIGNGGEVGAVVTGVTQTAAPGNSQTPPPPPPAPAPSPAPAPTTPPADTTGSSTPPADTTSSSTPDTGGAGGSTTPPPPSSTPSGDVNGAPTPSTDLTVSGGSSGGTTSSGTAGATTDTTGSGTQTASTPPPPAPAPAPAASPAPAPAGGGTAASDGSGTTSG